MSMEVIAMIVAGGTIAIGSIGPALGEARNPATRVARSAHQMGLYLWRHLSR